jgi:hypothetical protein
MISLFIYYGLFNDALGRSDIIASKKLSFIDGSIIQIT